MLYTQTSSWMLNQLKFNLYLHFGGKLSYQVLLKLFVFLPVRVFMRCLDAKFEISWNLCSLFELTCIYRLGQSLHSRSTVWDRTSINFTNFSIICDIWQRAWFIKCLWLICRCSAVYSYWFCSLSFLMFVASMLL